MWLWCVFIDEVIWTAPAMDTDRFHVLVSLLRRLILARAQLSALS